MNQLLYFLPMASVLVLSIARFLELGKKREVIRGPVKENLTLRLFILTGALVSAGSIVEYIVGGGGMQWLPFIGGWLLGICSFILRRRAIAALGRFWSLHVEIRDSHEFVRTGPFHFVRHPVYFSMILELLAFAVVCHSWITVLITPFLFVPILLMRVRMEELALIEKFGDGYREYQRTTPAIFPRPW